MAKSSVSSAADHQKILVSVLATLVLDQTKRIDAFVAAGKITVAQATILLISSAIPCG